MTISYNGLTLYELETIFITTGARFVIEDGKITRATWG